MNNETKFKENIPVYHPWHPMSDTVDVKHLSKFAEELGECTAAAMRCLMQGILEKEPTTGKVNKEWLEEEIADIFANAELCVKHFGLTISQERVLSKMRRLSAWHEMA